MQQVVPIRGLFVPILPLFRFFSRKLYFSMFKIFDAHYEYVELVDIAVVRIKYFKRRKVSVAQTVYLVLFHFATGCTNSGVICTNFTPVSIFFGSVGWFSLPTGFGFVCLPLLMQIKILTIHIKVPYQLQHHTYGKSFTRRFGGCNIRTGKAQLFCQRTLGQVVPLAECF